MAEILYAAHCEKTFEDFLCVFQSILKNFSEVGQKVEGLAKNYREELEIQESALSKASFHLALLSRYLCYLLLGIIVAVSHCEFRRREKENKRCDRAEGSAAILPTIAELLRFRLVALTRLHQLSSHVYSSSVAALKALFVLRTKDQLDTLCRFPLLSPLHYMPHQFLIDRSSSIFHVMPGRNKRLSTGKKGEIPLLFFLIVNVVVNEKKKKKIKGTTLEMYSPLNFFLR